MPLDIAGMSSDLLSLATFGVKELTTTLYSYGRAEAFYVTQGGPGIVKFPTVLCNMGDVSTCYVIWLCNQKVSHSATFVSIQRIFHGGYPTADEPEKLVTTSLCNERNKEFPVSTWGNKVEWMHASSNSAGVL